jgi:hypothetical protein
VQKTVIAPAGPVAEVTCLQQGAVHTSQGQVTDDPGAGGPAPYDQHFLPHVPSSEMEWTRTYMEVENGKKES